MGQDLVLSRYYIRMIMWQGKERLIIKGLRLISITKVKIKMTKIKKKVLPPPNPNRGTVQGDSRGARPKGRSSGARGEGTGWLPMRRKLVLAVSILSSSTNSLSKTSPTPSPTNPSPYPKTCPKPSLRPLPDLRSKPYPLPHPTRT